MIIVASLFSTSSARVYDKCWYIIYLFHGICPWFNKCLSQLNGGSLSKNSYIWTSNKKILEFSISVPFKLICNVSTKKCLRSLSPNQMRLLVFGII